MAKIVNVTDVPEFPGAGLLHFDDGRPPLMALPEIADEHRERLGMSAMQDGVAGPGAAPERHDIYGNPLHKQVQPSGLEQAIGNAWKSATTPAAAPAGYDRGNPSRADPNIDPVSGQPLPPGVKIAAPGEIPPTPPPAQAPTPAPSQPGPQSAGGPIPPEQAAEPAGAPVDPALAASDARLDEMMRTGRGPAGPATPARPAGFSPDTRKVVTEAGPAYDVHAAGDRLDAGAMVLDAQMAKAATEKQTVDAMAAHAAAQNLEAQQRLAAQQADIQRKKMEFQQQDSRLQQDLADYSESAKPDQSVFWSTPGAAFSSLISLIGQGIGAAGATLGHTDNWAFQAAQQKIRLEMAAQEKAYDAGRGDRKNALARLTEYYHGDIDMAKLALQQSLNKVAETETNRFAAQARSKDISANAQLMAAQFQQQQLLSEQARAELAQGKTTKTYDEKYHQASGGSSGGKPLTLEQELALRKGKQKPGVGPKEELKTQIAYGEKKRDTLDARQSVEEEAKAYGLHRNRDTGEFVDASGKPVDPENVSIPGVGRLHMPSSGFFSTEAARAARRARIKTTSAYRKATTGVAFSPQEAKEAEEAMHGETEADAVRTLIERSNALDERDRAIDAEHPPEIVENYRRRQGETNIERNKRGAAHPKVTPYAGRADDEPEPTE